MATEDTPKPVSNSMWSFSDALALAFNFAASVGIIFINKGIFATLKFRYTTFLTAMHYMVTLLGLEIPKLLHLLSRLVSDRWVKLTELIGVARNLDSATAAADAVAAMLNMLRDRDIEPFREWLGASPRAQELQRLVEELGHMYRPAPRDPRPAAHIGSLHVALPYGFLRSCPQVGLEIGPSAGSTGGGIIHPR